MTEIEFAQHCARLAMFASRWAADALDTRNDDPRHTAHAEPVHRFIREARERLQHMENKLQPRADGGANIVTRHENITGADGLEAGR